MIAQSSSIPESALGTPPINVRYILMKLLFRIDPDSNEIVEHGRVVEPLSGGTVIVTDDSIWGTAYDESLLFRLSPE